MELRITVDEHVVNYAYARWMYNMDRPATARRPL